MSLLFMAEFVDVPPSRPTAHPFLKIFAQALGVLAASLAVGVVIQRLEDHYSLQPLTRDDLRERIDYIFQLADDGDFDEAFAALDELEAKVGSAVEYNRGHDWWGSVRLELERMCGVRARDFYDQAAVH